LCDRLRCPSALIHDEYLRKQNIVPGELDRTPRKIPYHGDKDARRDVALVTRPVNIRVRGAEIVSDGYDGLLMRSH